MVKGYLYILTFVKLGVLSHTATAHQEAYYDLSYSDCVNTKSEYCNVWSYCPVAFSACSNFVNINYTQQGACQTGQMACKKECS